MRKKVASMLLLNTMKKGSVARNTSDCSGVRIVVAKAKNVENWERILRPYNMVKKTIVWVMKCIYTWLQLLVS